MAHRSASADSQSLGAEIRPPSAPAAALGVSPPAAALPEAREHTSAVPEIPIERAWLIGDSLSVGYSQLMPFGHIPPEQIKHDPKHGYPTRIGSAVGGSLTLSMHRRMEREIAEKNGWGLRRW